MEVKEELVVIPWEEIIELFDSKYTSEIYTRQLDALDLVFEHRQNGATVVEFRYLAGLLERCLLRLLAGRREFDIPCFKIMTIMGTPFVRERSFEEVMNRNLLAEALKILSTPLSLELSLEISYPSLVIAAAESLSLFLDPTRGFGCDLGVVNGRSIPQVYDNDINFALMKESGIITVVVDCLKRVSKGWLQKSYMLCLVLIKACRDLSFSKFCAEVVVDVGIIEIVPKMLSCNFADPLSRDTVQLLWNLLEVGGPNAATNMLKDDNCVIALTRTLHDMLESGYKTREKEIRNELLVVLLFLCKNESAPAIFVRAGTTILILQHCTWGQNTRTFINVGKEDIEMYQLMWYILQFLVRDWRNLGIICEFKFVQALIEPLRVKNLLPVIKKLSRKHIVSLQNQSIEILDQLMGKILHRFVEYKAPQILFDMVYSRTSVGVHIDQVSTILRLITVYANACTVYPTPGYLKPIATEEVVSGLVDILDDKKILFDPICELMSTIARNHMSCRSASENMLTLLLERLWDGGLQPRSLCITLKCIWCCMAKTTPRIWQFIDQDGIKCLLWILETVRDKVAIRLALQLLTDIISYPCAENRSTSIGDIALKRFKMWRSSISKEVAVTVLIKIWERIEGVEGQLEKHRIEHFLVVVENPLKGREVGDEKSDIRFLISWLFCRVSMDYVTEVLSMLDQTKIIYAMIFISLVERQAWEKIAESVVGNELIYLDKEYLDICLNKFLSITVDAVEKQKKMLQEAEIEEAKTMAFLKNTLQNVCKKKGQMFGVFSSVASDRVKMSKDQKDMMVSRSLLPEETLKNVLGFESS